MDWSRPQQLSASQRRSRTVMRRRIARLGYCISLEGGHLTTTKPPSKCRIWSIQKYHLIFTYSLDRVPWIYWANAFEFEDQITISRSTRCAYFQCLWIWGYIITAKQMKHLRHLWKIKQNSNHFAFWLHFNFNFNFMLQVWGLQQN